MELFKITCVTCQAGLSVRNEAILGKIVACPKCGSMVEVVAPGETAAPPSEAGSPVAAIESSALVPPVEEPIAEAPSELAPQVAAEVSSFRGIAWAVAILVVGAMVLGATIFWPAYWPAEPEVTEAAPPTVPEQSEPSEIEHPVVEEPTAVESVATEDLPATTSELQPPSEDSRVQPEVGDEAIFAEAPVQVQKAKPQAVVAPVEAKAVARRYDPLDLDPEALDLASLENTIEKETPVEPIASPVTIESSGEPANSTLPIVRRVSDPKRDIAATDAEQQLARRLPALELRSMPLVDFLTLVSQLSGSPVSVGSEQLQMAGISAREKVSLDARDIRLDEALTQVLEPLRLTHIVDGPQVIVVRKDADQVREIEYPIDDLVSKGTSAEQLVDWIRQLVAPDSWQESSLKIAGDSLRIEQSQRVHYQVLIFLERLRLVRGLSTRSRYPVERLAPTPLHAAMATRLMAPALFTFSRETPLGQVFLHWQRELDLPLLIDWPSLAEVQLWPESTVICAVTDRPWQEVLTEVLDPLGLNWRVATGGAIEIFSAEHCQRNLQLELYPLSADKSVDATELLDGLREHVLKKRTPAAAEQRTKLVYDPTGPTILALQPATAQREILTWLIEQGLFRQP